MNPRRALTLVELLIVLAIVAAMIGLLLPAVQSARMKAREAVCKNNLHQLNVAIAGFAEAHKRLPKRGMPGALGGWTVEILPFLEQSNREEEIPYGTPIADAPDSLFHPPPVLRCPIRESLHEHQRLSMLPGHYVLVAADRRDSFSLYDAPLELSIPWASGPEMAPRTVTPLVGPHRGGFFYSRGFQQGVDFVDGGNAR